MDKNKTPMVQNFSLNEKMVDASACVQLITLCSE